MRNSKGAEEKDWGQGNFLGRAPKIKWKKKTKLGAPLEWFAH